jgi:hypothetical protein
VLQPLDPQDGAPARHPRSINLLLSFPLIRAAFSRGSGFVHCLAMLLAGCEGSFRGDASAGPNPGGGFYGAPNIDIGRINP